MDADIKDIYTHFSVLKKELEKRREDKFLVKKVRDLFKPNPFFIDQVPRAFLSRSIATPNRELKYFIDLANSLSLEPMVLEYNGKFVARNKEKYFLCKPHFINDFQSKKCSNKKIINFNNSEGKLIHDLVKDDGEKLVDFHRKLLSRAPFIAENNTINIINITDWFNNVRQQKEGYYFYFLSLFIIDGILFENYLLLDKDEKSFFIEKIWPSFKKVEQYFGVKPLIFPLLPISHENREEWLYYPKELEEVI